MPIFQRIDPDTKAQKDLAATLETKRSDRKDLIERLGIAEAAVVAYQAKALQIAADGFDEAAISAAESKKHGAETRVITLNGAISKVDKIIAGLEHEIEVIVDRRCRSETNLAVVAVAERIAKAQAVADAGLKELAEAMHEGGLILPAEATAVAMFTDNVRGQLPAAVEMVVGALRTHGRAVLEGRAPASLPARPAPAPKLAVVQPPPETMNVLALRALKYLDAKGDVVTIGRRNRCDLPKPLAEEAIASNLALPTSDPRCRALGLSASPYTPTEESCVWLGPVGAAAEPVYMRQGGKVVHSQFEVMDRGKPYSVPVARAPEPIEEPALPLAVGQRNLPAPDTE